MKQINLFSHNLYVTDFEKHNEVKDILERVVEDYQKVSANNNIQHVNTWESVNNIHTNNALNHITKSDVVSSFVKEQVQSHDIKQGQTIGITKGWFYSVYPGGCITKHRHTNSFFTGLYFLNSPSKAGSLVVENPASEYYFNKIHVESKNQYNSWEQFCPMPEGQIFFIPGYLNFRTTINNEEKNPLNIICFDLEIIQK